jgi:hypothetical protein
MKRARIPVAALVLAVIALAARAEAAPIVAFGYLENKSRDANYDYLETIFPNSFANSLRNIFYINILKPAQINKELEKGGLSLEKEYRPHELMELTERIGADYFIYGTFVTLPNDRISISLKLYGRGLNRIFSFSNEGKMETEIFRLVDRITAIMVDFLGTNNFYLSRIIPRGSKLGIFTNLEGADLNYLYCALMNGGYRVASIQGNTLRNDVPEDLLEGFKCVEASETSYQRVSDPRSVRFLHGTWTGERYYEEITYTREAYRIYDTGYLDAKFDALARLAAQHGIDQVLVIGFNALKSTAWVRCLDLKKRDLVWMESNIGGGLPRICEKILARMGAELTRK